MRSEPTLPDGLDRDLLLRPAVAQDAAAVAAVHLRARHAAAAAGTMPPPAHPDDEVRGWLADRLSQDETWVAELAGVVVGYARFTPDWLDDLYVDPAHSGAGVGSALLDLVKARLAGGFGLWVFECNAPARRFYARHGLVERRVTDGSGNEEQTPDVEVAWAPG